MEWGTPNPSKERIESLQNRVRNLENLESCREEIKDLIEAESAQLDRAEAS